MSVVRESQSIRQRRAPFRAALIVTHLLKITLTTTTTIIELDQRGRGTEVDGGGQHRLSTEVRGGGQVTDLDLDLLQLRFAPTS